MVYGCATPAAGNSAVKLPVIPTSFYFQTGDVHQYSVCFTGTKAVKSRVFRYKSFVKRLFPPLAGGEKEGGRRGAIPVQISTYHRIYAVHTGICHPITKCFKMGRKSFNLSLDWCMYNRHRIRTLREHRGKPPGVIRLSPDYIKIAHYLKSSGKTGMFATISPL